MAWGKLESTFARDPKWKRLGQMLGIPRAHAAGLVACLYSWAAGNAPDGNVSDLSDDEIEEECLWEGDSGALVAALKKPQIGVLEKTRAGLVIHRFMERAENHKAALRMRRYRERKKDDVTPPVRETTANGDVTGDVTVTGERREREEREEREEGGARVIAREEPTPPVSDSLLEVTASAIAVDRAQRLCDVYHAEMATKRGHAPVLVPPPMRLQHARTLIAMAGGNDELAADVVRAYVHSDHEWWKQKRWALHVLTDARDFEHGMQLAAKGAAAEARRVEAAKPKVEAAEAMTPAQMRATAAQMRKLDPNSPIAAKLEARAAEAERTSGVS